MAHRYRSKCNGLVLLCSTCVCASSKMHLLRRRNASHWPGAWRALPENSITVGALLSGPGYSLKAFFLVLLSSVISLGAPKRHKSHADLAALSTSCCAGGMPTCCRLACRLTQSRWRVAEVMCVASVSPTPFRTALLHELPTRFRHDVNTSSTSCHCVASAL